MIPELQRALEWNSNNYNQEDPIRYVPNRYNKPNARIAVVHSLADFINAVDNYSSKNNEVTIKSSTEKIDAISRGFSRFIRPISGNEKEYYNVFELDTHVFTILYIERYGESGIVKKEDTEFFGLFEPPIVHSCRRTALHRMKRFSMKLPNIDTQLIDDSGAPLSSIQTEQLNIAIQNNMAEIFII